jgi:hypothetical protein
VKWPNFIDARFDLSALANEEQMFYKDCPLAFWLWRGDQKICNEKFVDFWLNVSKCFFEVMPPPKIN